MVAGLLVSYPYVFVRRVVMNDDGAGINVIAPTRRITVETVSLMNA